MASRLTRNYSMYTESHDYIDQLHDCLTQHFLITFDDTVCNSATRRADAATWNILRNFVKQDKNTHLKHVEITFK